MFGEQLDISSLCLEEHLHVSSKLPQFLFRGELLQFLFRRKLLKVCFGRESFEICFGRKGGQNLLDVREPPIEIFEMSRNHRIDHPTISAQILADREPGF
jgi:hypothetical protein